MATIKDVAAEAGLTVTTVSRVLNNRGYISDDARKRVHDAMEKLNYKPNEVARSLHNKRTNTIGVIVPHIRHPYFAEMISSVEKEAYKEGYRILICNSQDKEEKEKEYIDICTQNRVAGIILFSGLVGVQQFVSLDIPVIVMERSLDGGTASVECDNEAGGELAARKLIDDGCKKILYIGSTTTFTQMPADNRAKGFFKVCEEKGIEYLEVDPMMSDYYNLTYIEMIEKSLLENKGIDGIFASSDVIAAQCLQVCNKHGIKVPEDMKLIGFDDSMIAEMTSPPLTTIHQPIREMARYAVEMLKSSANGETVAKQVVLPVTLVERGSA